MFSKSAEYRIRAIIFLAHKFREKGEKIPLKQIAKGTNIPEAYAGKLLKELTNKKIIGSIKGPGGGFFLLSNSLDFTLYEIHEIFEGKDSCCQCYLGLPNCSDANPCPVHFQYVPVINKLKIFLKSTTIKDIVSGIDIINSGYRFRDN